jgi:formiminoglutamase
MESPSLGKWSLINIPDHQGVLNVGGRIGAAFGPAEFRRSLRKLNGRDFVQETLASEHSLDPITNDAQKNHENASNLILKAQPSETTVVVGGGHDHGYSQLLGVHKLKGPKIKIGCINLDAHFDVRRPDPLPSSGSPFYLALENKILDPAHFIEFGIQRHCNAPALWDYIEKNNIQTQLFEDLRHDRAVPEFEKNLAALSQKTDVIVLSFDLDCVAQAFAPGVSAPQTEGFTPSEILEMMALAGKNPKVISLGIFELNPVHDVDSRTAKLAATAAYHFIRHAIRRTLK